MLSGQRHISVAAAEALASEVSGSGPGHERLSGREFEVMRLLASGHSVSQVARDLGLSVKTISTYRSQILRKLRLQTTNELMRYGIQSGLVLPNPRGGAENP